MRTNYIIDDYQQSYFVIPSYDHLLAQTLETDFGPLYDELAVLDDLGVAQMIAGDRSITV